jgi:hypothetical protein
MQKICPISGTTFEVTEADLEFLNRFSPVIGGRQYIIPPPTLSPEERKRRRLAFRNERNLYHRKCDLSGKSIISLYSPDKACKVYAKDVWWSDNWDALEYGRNFNFERPFFEQFAELKAEVPRLALVTDPFADQNNCQYINFAGNSKNCYMTFDSDFNEDSIHSNVLKHSRNCLDCSYVFRSELCYECIDCSYCYNLHYSQDCSNCSDSYFLNNCIGCTNCFGCSNLVRKEFYIFNKSHSREDYFRLLESYKLDQRSAVQELSKKFSALAKLHPKKYCHILKCIDCTGDYLLNAKNCYYCFNISEAEDLRYCDALYGAKNCMDVSSFGENIECVYESGTIGINCQNIFMSFTCVDNVSGLIYCDECRNTKDCIGCAGLFRKQYCIFNQQYSKEEYEQLAPRLIEHMQKTGEWGEFFPIGHSMFGYNESMAQEYFPLNKQEASEFGVKWSGYESPAPHVKLLQSSEIPESLSDVSDDILNMAIACDRSGKPFRIVKQELDFYRKQNVPIPVLHPDERYHNRIAMRNPQKLWKRECAQTGREVYSSYAPGRPEKILCEEAFAECLE